MLKVLSGLLQTKVITEGKDKIDRGVNANKGLPLRRADKCQADCVQCFEICPTQALTPQGVNPRQCIYCLRCKDICPTGAIETTPIPIISASLKEEELGQTLRAKVKRICRGSLHIRYVDAGACNGCDFEINALTNPVYDLQQYGIDFVASPRHADMLLVTGVVTRNLEIALQKTYEACPQPTLVVAVGSCAGGGGVFKDAYAAGGGVDKYLPVDVYVPGCPPTPALILKGILTALGRKGF
jgi:Ni,Fe-hydrogenase III small subunit/NAD-dependent dihydropyrimidine dehydrogenase PreA subunit